MADALPARLLTTSEGLDWAEVPARRYRDDPVAEPFTTEVSPDLLVVLVTAGVYAIESHGRRPRSGPCTAPAASASRLRAKRAP